MVEEYAGYLVIIAILIGWMIIIRVLSSSCGWRDLAEKYPVPDDIDTDFITKHRLLNLAMRRHSNLELCVILRCNYDGILVSMTRCFWPMFPSFFVPWQDIVTEDTDKTRFGLIPRYKQVILRFKRSPDSPLYLRETEWKRLLQKAENPI